MHRVILRLIESSRTHINKGNAKEKEQKLNELCLTLKDMLSNQKPKTPEEKAALDVAFEKLAQKDIEGIYNVLEPYCVDHRTLSPWLYLFVILQIGAIGAMVACPRFF